jgi:PadR family transcriptional regulator PadR
MRAGKPPLPLDGGVLLGVHSHSQTMGRRDQAPELLPGTLYMLILQTLARLGPMHGYGIALHIEETSGDVLRVEEGSLYPALQRMLVKGWVVAEWSRSENNRRARYYRLTPAGRRQLAAEVGDFERVIAAIHRVLEPV